MIDAQNLDTVGDVVNGVQDPVGAATSTEQPLEFPLEWFPDAAWEGRQVSENTLDNRVDDAWRDALQVAPCSCGHDDLVAHRSSVGELNSARICSCVRTRPAATSAIASPIDSRMPGWDSQNSVS